MSELLSNAARFSKTNIFLFPMLSKRVNLRNGARAGASVPLRLAPTLVQPHSRI
jgi:hypothetical protein